MKKMSARRLHELWLWYWQSYYFRDAATQARRYEVYKLLEEHRHWEETDE